MAAAVSMIAGCYKPEMIQIAAPEDVVAPVLEAVEGPIEITPANMGLEKVTFNWSAADYGVMTQVNYSLEAATAAAPDTKVTITSGLTATTAELTYEALNQILFNDLKLNDGVAEDVLFMVGAKVGEYEKIYSNAITVSCKVTAAEKVYPKLTVAGSYAYNNWTPGKGQFVFDFDGTDAKYSGMIDFGEDVSALNFKFVGSAWGENEFSVPSGEEQAAEAAELPLVAGGGDNIAAYTTHRYYNLTLDKATPKVIKNFSFNSLGVIGDATPTGWDADTDMSFNTEKQRFYVDLTLIDGKIKFRADDGWDVNWGGADGVLSAGGADIVVPAGNYRIYVNLNDPANPTYELNKGMYGKDEPTSGTTTPEPEPEPEPTPVVGWGLVGEYNSWGGTPDIMLASDGTYLVAKGVELSGQVKFRKDGGWDVNFGAPGDVEPVEIAVNTELELAAGGKNFTIAAGTYDVYLDETNAKAWFINDGSYPGGGAAPEVSIYGVIGVNNDWTNDIMMYEVDGLYVAYNVTFTADGGFKVRKAGAWDDTANFGLEGGKASVEVDHVYDVITSGGSGDLLVAAGTYDIWFDLENMKIYIMTPGKSITEAEGGEAVVPEPDPEQAWFMVGNFNSWNPADEAYKMTAEGDFYVFKNFTAAEGCEVKFAPGEWNGDKGGDGTFAVNVANPTGGNNIAVTAGTYDVYLAKDLSAYYFMEVGKTPVVEKTWYMVGNFNSWNPADEAYKMTSEGDFYVFKNFTAAEGCEAKFAPGEWNGDKGGDGTFAVGTANPTGGNNIAVTAGTYDVYLKKDLTAYYFMEVGNTPAN